MHVHLGPILDKRYKDTKNLTATFEELGAKAGYCACPLYTPPPSGQVKLLNHPSSLDTPFPSPHIRKKLAPFFLAFPWCHQGHQ